MTQGKNSKNTTEQEQKTGLTDKGNTVLKPVVIKITDRDLLARMRVVLQQSGWKEPTFLKLSVRMMVERFEEINRQQREQAEAGGVLQFPKRKTA